MDLSPGASAVHPGLVLFQFCLSLCQSSSLPSLWSKTSFEFVLANEASKDD